MSIGGIYTHTKLKHDEQATEQIILNHMHVMIQECYQTVASKKVIADVFKVLSD